MWRLIDKNEWRTHQKKCRQSYYIDESSRTSIMIDISIDTSYNFQSYCRISKWTDCGWKVVYNIPFTHVLNTLARNEIQLVKKASQILSIDYYGIEDLDEQK